MRDHPEHRGPQEGSIKGEVLDPEIKGQYLDFFRDVYNEFDSTGTGGRSPKNLADVVEVAQSIPLLKIGEFSKPEYVPDNIMELGHVANFPAESDYYLLTVNLARDGDYLIPVSYRLQDIVELPGYRDSADLALAKPASGQSKDFLTTYGNDPEILLADLELAYKYNTSVK